MSFKPIAYFIKTFNHYLICRYSSGCSEEMNGWVSVWWEVGGGGVLSDLDKELHRCGGTSLKLALTLSAICKNNLSLKTYHVSICLSENLKITLFNDFLVRK